MMSGIDRMLLGGLGGLMLLGGTLAGEAGSESAAEEILVLLRSDDGLELADGVLTLMGSPVTATVIEHHENGILKRSEEWVDGRRHGSSISWHSNAQVNELRTWLEGRKEGQHMGWYADGTLRFDYRYAHGLLEGNALEWYPSGILYRDFNYVAGQESGTQRMWSLDGSLRANYVVREGRRFGLIGSKGCTGEPVDAAALFLDQDADAGDRTPAEERGAQ